MKDWADKAVALLSYPEITPTYYHYGLKLIGIKLFWIEFYSQQEGEVVFNELKKEVRFERTSIPK